MKAEKRFGLESKYLQAGGYSILYIIVYLTIFKITENLYFMKWGNVMFAGRQLQNNVPLYHLVLDVSVIPAFLLIFILLKRQNLFKAVNFGRVNWKTVGIIAVLTFFVSLFTSAFMKMPWAPKIFPNVAVILTGRLLGQALLQFAIWLPLHAIWKEMLFRGIIYNEFRRVMPLTLALILHATMEGLLFFRFIEFDLVFYAFLSCMIFGLVYAWCNSLWASFLAQIILEGFLLIWKVTNYVIFTETTTPIILGCSAVLILYTLLYLREYCISLKKNESADTNATVATNMSTGAIGS